MKELTKQQRDVYEFIRRKIREDGYPPSRREVTAWLGCKSPNSGHQVVGAIVKKGWLIKDKKGRIKENSRPAP